MVSLKLLEKSVNPIGISCKARRKVFSENELSLAELSKK